MAEKENGELKTLDGCPITPGPWFVRAATFCDDGIPSFEVVMPGEPRMGAPDARVIGAAPVLFASCIAMLERHTAKAAKRRKYDRNFDGCNCNDCLEIGAALALANVPNAAMPRLGFICDKCGIQQHADGICANCGGDALRSQKPEDHLNG